MMKLSELGEFALIDRIRAQVTPGAGVVRGIGDDAAQLEIPAGEQLLTSTDLLIETSHFDFTWTSPADLGHKAVAVNLSDIAAMGGTPRYLYLGLACPGSAEVEAIEAFMAGALAQTEAHGVTLVGGDTCRSPGPWVVSVTVEGTVAAGCAIGRDGARPGDVVVVSGVLGDSALALTQLLRGQQPPDSLARRHHRPEARVALGRALAESGSVTAMIDLSDGLASDLGHILEASQVGACLELESLPRSEPFAAAVQADPALLELALSGGEDYELLFTLAEAELPAILELGRRLKLSLTPIGRIHAGAPTLTLRDAVGNERLCQQQGFDHFSSPKAEVSDA